SWCADNAPHGVPLPPELRTPPPLSDLTAKNDYDQRLQAFLRAQEYKSALNWSHDQQWRLTGPYAGEIGSGDNYGTHPAVKLYYSPEIVNWLCSDRAAPLPDGAMIIKEMHSIDAGLGIELTDNACMDITEDPEPESWTIMVKNAEASADGWYWGYYAVASDSTAPNALGNPPILGKAAVTTLEALDELNSSTQRNPDFYP
ncbi:MAG: hypothetical protein KC620_27005, partial [Myxococcales bacterium]|nr:hypothetical protein [Myxococcales bacterium]